jgi:NAD(P)-dependent dehydrogenase (short-subunit alcohol dehydrogenase family)
MKVLENIVAIIFNAFSVIGREAVFYADKKTPINVAGIAHIDISLLSDSRDEERIKFLMRPYPTGRLGTSEEIAELVLWLSSLKSSFVIGN